MTYLDLLRQDWNDFEIVRLAHLKNGEPPATQSRTSATLLALRRDLENLGVLIAICGTLANSLLDERVDQTDAHSMFICFLPQNERTLRQFVESLFAEEPVLAAAIGDVDDRILFARRITESWLRTSKKITTPIVETTVLADVWQKSCVAILKIDQLLQIYAPDNWAHGCRGTTGNMRATLAEVLDGGTACLDHFGRLSVAGWAERRSSGRKYCDFDATLSFDARSLNCKVVNISETGFRLSLLWGAEPSGDLLLTVGDRTLGGSVVWQRGDCLGAKWNTPLATNDDLLTGAAVTPNAELTSALRRMRSKPAISRRSTTASACPAAAAATLSSSVQNVIPTVHASEIQAGSDIELSVRREVTAADPRFAWSRPNVPAR